MVFPEYETSKAPISYLIKQYLFSLTHPGDHKLLLIINLSLLKIMISKHHLNTLYVSENSLNMKKPQYTVIKCD